LTRSLRKPTKYYRRHARKNGWENALSSDKFNISEVSIHGEFKTDYKEILKGDKTSSKESSAAKDWALDNIYEPVNRIVQRNPEFFGGTKEKPPGRKSFRLEPGLVSNSRAISTPFNEFRCEKKAQKAMAKYPRQALEMLEEHGF